MPIKGLTCAIIAIRNDIIVNGSPHKNGKYVGSIISNGKALFNTEPIYDTMELAIEAMTSVVERIRQASQERRDASFV